MACLNEDEKTLGTILIDFGGGQTGVSIFKNQEMIFSGYVPLGGLHITSDIALGLATSIESAERVKTLYGNLISTAKDEQSIIDIPQIGDDGRSEINHIQRANLLAIIKPRIDEILEMVAKEIVESGYSNISGNIVITGSASQIGGIKELVAHTFSKRVRQGLPKQIEGLAESTKGPAFSTGIGILLLAKQQYISQGNGVISNISKWDNPFQRLFKWFKENF